jgi:hypothetical protein
MSAFVVSKSHIDALVHAAYFGPRDVHALPQQSGHWYKPNFRGCQNWALDQMDEVGEMLVKENLSSIHARYPDTVTDPEGTPGPVEQYWLQRYEHEMPKQKMGVVEALKALDCYEYQSCEHPEWETSEAFRFCRSMRHSLIGCLPGYDAAPWEWDEALRTDAA